MMKFTGKLSLLVLLMLSLAIFFSGYSISALAHGGEAGGHCMVGGNPMAPGFGHMMTPGSGHMETGNYPMGYGVAGMDHCMVSGSTMTPNFGHMMTGDDLRAYREARIRQLTEELERLKRMDSEMDSELGYCPMDTEKVGQTEIKGQTGNSSQTGNPAETGSSGHNH